MQHRIKNLTNIANKMDQSGLVKAADGVDKIASNILKIVQAQYVGVQGYWIRNERCWSNCWRTKRAQSPDKSAQEIWQDCQNEYVESINNLNSGWEKYAQDNEDTSRLVKKAQHIIQKEDEFFRNSVAEKMLDGKSLPVAVYDTIKNNHEHYIKQYVAQANNLLKIASALENTKHQKVAMELASEAAAIIKESAFWDKKKLYQQNLSELKQLLNDTSKGLDNYLMRINVIQQLPEQQKNTQLPAILQKMAPKVSMTARNISVMLGNMANTNYGWFGDKYNKKISAMLQAFQPYFSNLNSASQNLLNDPETYIGQLQAFDTLLKRADQNAEEILRESAEPQAEQQQKEQQQQTQDSDGDGVPDAQEKQQQQTANQPLGNIAGHLQNEIQKRIENNQFGVEEAKSLAQFLPFIQKKINEVLSKGQQTPVEPTPVAQKPAPARAAASPKRNQPKPKIPGSTAPGYMGSNT